MTYTEPLSYWQATLPTEPLPADALPAKAKVVVIGGGILGAATALWLARAGASPVLIEREALAAGASGRNGGLVVPGTAEAYPAAIARHGHQAAREVWALTVAGLAQLDTLIAEESISCDHRLVGSLSLALDEDQFAQHARTVEQLRADGFAAELLDRAAVQELVKTPLGPQIVGAKYLPQGRALHSARLVRGLAEAARRHGAFLCTGVEALSVAVDGAGLKIVTSAGSLHAEAAVVALNAWSARLLPELAGLITPVRGQILAYEPLPPLFPTPIGVGLTPTGEYWQQTPAGSVVIGGYRALAPGGDVGITEVTGTPEVHRAIEGVLPQLFPTIGLLAVARRWAGTMGFSPDYLPLAGRMGELPLWFAGGFSGHGMPFGLPLGQLLAEAALNGVTPTALAPFSRDRLAASRTSKV